MKYKTIIFDFDGTIADTWSVVVDIINGFARQFGFKKILPSDHESLRNKTLRELARYFRVSQLRMPWLVRRVRSILRQRVNEIEPIGGIIETIRVLEKKEKHLGIITTNSKKTVKLFLSRYSIQSFGCVYSSLRSKGKTRALKRMMKRFKTTPEETLYIGDEKGDVISAHKAGIASVAVTWGLHSQDILEKQNSEYVISQPKDLLDIILESN